MKKRFFGKKHVKRSDLERKVSYPGELFPGSFKNKKFFFAFIRSVQIRGLFKKYYPNQKLENFEGIFSNFPNKFPNFLTKKGEKTQKSL